MRNLFFWVLLISLGFSLLAFPTQTESSQARVLVPYTEGKKVLQLYQLMKDVHDVLSLRNIEYWIMGGTLLGAVRHQGLIPWDNDLDICINKKQNNEFVAVIPIFEQFGYYVKSWTDRVGYRMYVKNEIEYTTNIAHIDVVLYDTEGDIAYYYWKNGQNSFKRDTIAVSELLPLKTYQFGSFGVKGPHYPFNYLTRCYGADFMSVAYLGNCPGKLKFLKKLKKSDMVPASPMGPLLDKFSDKVFSQKVSLETIKLSKETLKVTQLKEVCN